MPHQTVLNLVCYALVSSLSMAGSEVWLNRMWIHLSSLTSIFSTLLCVFIALFASAISARFFGNNDHLFGGARKNLPWVFVKKKLSWRGAEVKLRCNQEDEALTQTIQDPKRMGLKLRIESSFHFSLFSVLHSDTIFTVQQQQQFRIWLGEKKKTLDLSRPLFSRSHNFDLSHNKDHKEHDFDNWIAASSSSTRPFVLLTIGKKYQNLSPDGAGNDLKTRFHKNDRARWFLVLKRLA